MKRLFLISAIVLSLCAMAPVFAASITEEGEQTGTMDITYGVASGYTVTIPADLILEGTTAETSTVSATNVKIPYGTSLKVTISSDNYDGGWYLVDEDATANKVEYTIEDTNGEIAEDGIVLEVQAGAADLKGSNELTFQVPVEPTKAGDYKDTLSFTVAVSAYDPVSLD